MMSVVPCIPLRPSATERLRAEIDRRHVALDDLGAELLGLRAHLRHQVRAHDAVAIAREVLDQRRQHQLPAGLDAFDDERLQVGARGVQRGRQPGRARADDDDVTHGHWRLRIEIRIENRDGIRDCVFAISIPILQFV